MNDCLLLNMLLLNVISIVQLVVFFYRISEFWRAILIWFLSVSLCLSVTLWYKWMHMALASIFFHCVVGTYSRILFLPKAAWQKKPTEDPQRGVKLVVWKTCVFRLKSPYSWKRYERAQRYYGSLTRKSYNALSQLVTVHYTMICVAFDDLEWPWKAGRERPIFWRISAYMFLPFYQHQYNPAWRITHVRRSVF